MTKVEMFNEIVTMAESMGREDVKEFATHEIELLSKKHSASKPSKTQLENEKFRGTILEILKEKGSPMTISDLMEDTHFKGLTNQRITGLISPMVRKYDELGNIERDGKVIRSVVKGRPYYTLAEDVEVE